MKFKKEIKFMLQMVVLTAVALGIAYLTKS